MSRRSPSPSFSYCDNRLLLFPTLFILLIPSFSLALRPAASDRLDQVNATESNVSSSRPREGSFADMIDRALEHEFTENDQNEVWMHFANLLFLIISIEPIRNLFAALFLASIGMLINVHFLWNHVDILLASVILVIVLKTIIIAAVVKGFGYNNKTAVLVGMSMAQIGEFAFVLLSRASNLHLVEGKLYLLLLGTTVLSLVTTPLLFKLIPAVIHLGMLLRWFSPDSSVEVDNLRTDSGKQRIILMDQESHDS